MTWPRLAAIAAAALVLAAPATGDAAVRGTAVSSALAASGPAYKSGSHLCAVGTTHFRVIWDETRGSKQRPSGANARDGRCSTVPSRVRRIAGLMEKIRRSELALGFRPPASDAGLRRNGGDGRYDIYLARQAPGVLGQTACSYQTIGGRLGRRWSSTEIVAVQPQAVDPDRQLRETLAHEYFHGIQCRIAPRLNLLPASLVEGTANWMAAVVTPDWARAEGTFLGGLAGRMVQAASSTRSVTTQTYSSWGFWYEVTTGGINPGVIRKLFERQARRTRRASADSETRAVVRNLEPILMRYAEALRGARMLGFVELPQQYRNELRDPTPLIDLALGLRVQTKTVSVARIGYRFPGLAWDDDSGLITMRVTGAPATAVSLIGTFSTREVLEDGSVVFRVDGSTAGEATLILVNGSRTTRNVRIAVSH
jgi:hypothetical protein